MGKHRDAETKLRAAKLLDAGYPVKQVAATIGASLSTVYGWEKRRQKNLDKKKTKLGGGNTYAHPPTERERKEAWAMVAPKDDSAIYWPSVLFVLGVLAFFALMAWVASL